MKRQFQSFFLILLNKGKYISIKFGEQQVLTVIPKASEVMLREISSRVENPVYLPDPQIFSSEFDK